MPFAIHWTALLLAVTAAPAWPQVRFEVASIRPSQPGLTARDARHNFHRDSFVAKAMTVGDILDMLNGYQLFRVVGGPDWMRTDRYDIAAKAERPLETADLRQAVMALLSERFQLESHQEQREVPGIVLRAPRTPSGLKAGCRRRSAFGPHCERQCGIYGCVNVPCDQLSVANVERSGCGRNRMSGRQRFRAAYVPRRVEIGE